MVMRPAFQHQGPKGNCVIAEKKLGWLSCTAYAMAMLIDAATDGAHRPKGCHVRRLVRPRDVVKGLTLSQVAEVAEGTFRVPIAVRTGSNAITVESALKRVRGGRGFVLQGNNLGWGKGDVNHAIYVHAVRDGTAARPKEALVFDPQRQHERWIAWAKVLGFAEALRFDNGRTLGPDLFYAGFAPKPMTPAERASRGATAVDDGVELVFGARRLPRPDRTRANPAAGRLVNVRSTPRSLSRSTVVETLGDGALFVAYQKTRGVRPPGAASSTWFGNRDGTWWIHVSGLRRIGGAT
jgi:hypothetical protein